MRKIIAAGLTASLMAMVTAGAAFANPPDVEFRPVQPRGGPVRGPGFQGAPGPRGGQFHGGPGFRGGPGPYAGGRADGRFGGNGYRRHDGYGAAVGAGVAGLAAGALIGGALANQQTYDDGSYGAPVYAPPVYAPPAEYAEDVESGADDPSECAARYRSYDPGSGTYLGYDGMRHPCP